MATIKEKEPSEQFITHAVSGYKPKRRPWNLPSTPQTHESSAPVATTTFEDHPKHSPAEKAGDAEVAGVTNKLIDESSPAESAGDDSSAAPAAKAGDYLGGSTLSDTPAEKSGDAEKAPQTYTMDRSGNTSALHSLGWKLAEGTSRFTRVPHSFTDCLEKEDFSHREYRLLMLLLRETLGWGRACVVLRSKELLDRTKIPERHLRDTIKALERRGVLFVEERKTDGGQSLPSAFALNPKYFEKYESPAVSAGDAQTARAAESAGSSLAQSAGEIPRQKSEGCRIGIDSDSNHLHQEIGVLKKVLKKDLKKSLSHDQPAAWTEFTSQLTEKARERAEKVFQSLRNQFPSDLVKELAECPRNLERFGAPDGTPWGQISSPIGLMESSWPQLREFFRKRVAETQKANHMRERIEAERIKAEEQDRREAEESERQREAFLVAFPDEQGRREVIQKYLAGFPFNPDGSIGQMIAVGKWWDERAGEGAL